jgi:hypothetical protein
MLASYHLRPSQPRASELATKFTSQDTSVLPALVIFTGPADAAGVAAVGEFGIAVSLRAQSLVLTQQWAIT